MKTIPIFLLGIILIGTHSLNESFLEDIQVGSENMDTSIQFSVKQVRDSILTHIIKSEENLHTKAETIQIVNFYYHEYKN